MSYDATDWWRHEIGRNRAALGAIVTALWFMTGLDAGGVETVPRRVWRRVLEILLPAEAISWLLEVLGNQAMETERRLVEVRTPFGIPEDLPRALDGKLAAAAGLADSAYLAGAVYDDGSTGILLAFVDAKHWAEPALTRGASEVVSFSHQAATLDVAFLAHDAPLVARLERVALKFDLPKAPSTATIGAPGMDPEAPPRLR